MMPDAEDRPRRLRGNRSLGSRDRTPDVAGLAISVLAHLAVIALYPFFTGSDSPSSLSSPSLPVTPEPGGTQVVRIVEVATPAPGDPVNPLEIDDPADPDIVPDVPEIEGEGFRLPERYRSAGERLRVGRGDPRLWQPLPPELVEPTREQILRVQLLAEIASMHDSAVAEAERERRALDWTRTDEDGNRWGVSPGRIHLGKFSVPLPFGFGPPPDYSGDQAEMAFRLNDIDRAAGTRALRQSWKERSEVMRQRREEERKAAEEREQGTEGKPPPPVKPDTTSARRNRG